MNTPPNPVRRLSLDLPIFTHEDMDEIANVLGFMSKNEAARSALQDFYVKMSLVLEGYRLMVRDTKTGKLTPYYGHPLELLYQRVQKIKQP